MNTDARSPLGVPPMTSPDDDTNNTPGVTIRCQDNASVGMTFCDRFNFGRLDLGWRSRPLPGRARRRPSGMGRRSEQADQRPGPGGVSRFPARRAHRADLDLAAVAEGLRRLGRIGDQLAGGRRADGFPGSRHSAFPRRGAAMTSPPVKVSCNPARQCSMFRAATEPLVSAVLPGGGGGALTAPHPLVNLD